MTLEQEHHPLSVSAVNIKLPPFLTSDPELCFIQVKSQLASRRITEDLTTYHHVVSGLPPATACEIRDLSFAPPAEDAMLKKTLIRRVASSKPQRFQQLLRETELGDRTPSQLRRQMQQLLGTKATDLNSIMAGSHMQRSADAALLTCRQLLFVYRATVRRCDTKLVSAPPCVAQDIDEGW
ncbi:hypothetical protein HPB47_023147 [Ixodes persulcatus]|uniref:Uncharacterized protein n=1 Tax=Ixodes persulcatus TaxID=34615 RepID=A0AC60QA25_IXOPE|nr:hypothetical protein HPB47_023147 [Ixodes persulcatus]